LFITLHSLKIMESLDNRFTSQVDFNLHLKYKRVCLHVIFKYTTQNEVNDPLNVDTEVYA
jgi:hypothetical protein